MHKPFEMKYLKEKDRNKKFPIFNLKKYKTHKYHISYKNPEDRNWTVGSCFVNEKDALKKFKLNIKQKPQMEWLLKKADHCISLEREILEHYKPKSIK